MTGRRAPAPLALADPAGATGDATALPWQRSLPLSDGRRMEIRPVAPTDVDALGLLYSGLSQDDLHLRFFAAYRPPRSFFERMATVASRGGFGIVATVPDPIPRIVGEAQYAVLDNGDGELAITVAPDWRGWLGPLLLDALLAAAAARGVPNLEAEILVENRSMLALVRARGYATIDHEDFSVVRVLLGTVTTTPTWPGSHHRPRLLVEVRGGRWRAEAAARAAGWQVVTCPGPRPGPRPRCPVLEGSACPLVAGADVVVCGLDPEDAPGRAVRDAHAAATTPITVRTGEQGQPFDLHDADSVVVAALERLRPRGAAANP